MGAYVGPDITIEEGLVLNIDAANPKSYIGSGTLAYNMASPINSGSLIANPTFSSENAGAFNFDGVDSYIQVDPPIPQATTEITVNAWFKGTSQGSNSGANVIFVGNPGFSHGPYLGYDYNNESILWGVYINQTYNTVSGFTQDTIWNVCSTFNRPTLKTYKNGVLVDTDTQNTDVTYQNNTSGNRIGEWGYAGFQRTFEGQIYLVQVYNRELSQAEILQNYNALKPRFIN
tara:strand:- start:76 stop:768 length:693 start_codon:yes stop_codon:yes gene_type:complete